jgi:hypothetical protein
VSVLLHDLANTTQYLSTLSSLMSDGPALNAGLLGGLSETTSEVDELGFVLGLVAHAAGADVLLERARRDGLDALLVFVKRALRSEKRDLRLDDATRSRVRIDTPDRGRDATWAAGRFVFAAGRSLPAGTTLEFEIDGTRDLARLVCRVARSAELERCAREIEAQLPHFSFAFDNDTSTLVFPPGTLETGTP